jgi:phosphoenolpyruvate-protein kinase (PTS system EI component)
MRREAQEQVRSDSAGSREESLGQNNRQTRTIQGITISPGLAEGSLHLHRDLLDSLDAPEDIEPHAVEEEHLRLDVATTKIADDLLTLATRVEEEIDSRLAEVFGAHQLILGDSYELLDEMQQTLAAARGHTVCVRLLDIGADKPLPFMRFMAETNPSLGRRGIRYLREYPELLRTHLRALLELSKEFDVRILVPMVTLPEDVVAVKEQLTRLGAEMQMSALPSLGAPMIKEAIRSSSCTARLRRSH